MVEAVGLQDQIVINKTAKTYKERNTVVFMINEIYSCGAVQLWEENMRKYTNAAENKKLAAYFYKSFYKLEFFVENLNKIYTYWQFGYIKF